MGAKRTVEYNGDYVTYRIEYGTREDDRVIACVSYNYVNPYTRAFGQARWDHEREQAFKTWMRLHGYK